MTEATGLALVLQRPHKIKAGGEGRRNLPQVITCAGKDLMSEAGINSIAFLKRQSATRVMAIWTMLYAEALRSDPEELSDRIRIATESIIGRMRTIGAVGSQVHRGEHRALCLALSDLQVLRIAFSHSRGKGRAALFPY